MDRRQEKEAEQLSLRKGANSETLKQRNANLSNCDELGLTGSKSE